MRSFYVCLSFVLIVFTSCNSGAKRPKIDNTAKVEMIYRLPGLVGMNIDEIRKVLGKPEDKPIDPTKNQIKLYGDEWGNTFLVNYEPLLVTYDVRTRIVKDFFISSIDPSGMSSDYSILLQMWDLDTHENSYRIEPVPAIVDPTKYTGIKVIPQ